MKPADFLHNFDVVLLDMGETFMFGADRFRDPGSFVTAYREIGGGRLADGEVQTIINSLYRRITEAYQDPALIDRFPALRDALENLPEGAGLDGEEYERLMAVFERHEIGTIPPEYADILRRLHRTHRLGLVSNIWSPSRIFLELFDQLGIRELFTVIIFSSDHGAIKPSRVLFDQALAAFDRPPERVVMVGDKFKRDVAGAKAAGIAAVWISRDGAPPPRQDIMPDLIISDLRELVPSNRPGAGL